MNAVQNACQGALRRQALVTGSLFCLLCLGGMVLMLTWFEADNRSGRLTKTVENPEVLPWWWWSSNVGGMTSNRQAYLCVVDVLTGEFFPMGHMDTGRRELSAVAAYKPTGAFLWQCPAGTIVEMTPGEVARLRAEVRTAQEKVQAVRTLHQRAQDLVRERQRQQEPTP